MKPTWKELKQTWPAHYEEHIARVNKLTLRVRGPRNGHTYKWIVERVGPIGDHHEVAHGTCVERDLAQHAAVYHAQRVEVAA